MSDPLHDRNRLPAVLAGVAEAATRYLAAIDQDRLHSGRVEEAAAAFGGGLPERGAGSAEALALLAEEGIAATARSAGPRFFRPAISNWRTTEREVDVIVAVARELGESLAVSRRQPRTGRR